MINIIKRAIGRTMSPVSRNSRLGDLGQGGGGGYAGTAEEYASVFRKGGILLGRSLHDPSWKVGLPPERHLLTVASPGSGKGRSRTLLNMLLYPHSVVCIDVKGTHAAVTGYARGHGGGRVRRGMGQDVYVLNPFGIHEGAPGMPPSCRFNPLSTVDVNGLRVYEDIEAIAEGLVVPHMQGDSYFDDSAKNLIRGVIGHVLTAEDVQARTLVEVRRLLTQPEGPPLAAMAGNEACGGVIREAAAQMLVASEKEFSGILSTAIQQTGWIASRAMQQMLSGSDFNLYDLKRKPSTLYLVIPPEHLATHGRFLRLFVSLCVKAATRVGSAGVPQLFVLDEFFSLGRMDTLAASIANCRSYGITQWIILQSATQLRMYGDSWENFIGSAGAFELFGLSDLTTARYASELCGHVVVMRKDRDGVMRPAATAALRDAAEMMYELEPAGGRMVVYGAGRAPLLLNRINYDTLFKKSQYNPDPDIKGS